MFIADGSGTPTHTECGLRRTGRIRSMAVVTAFVTDVNTYNWLAHQYRNR